MTAEEQTVVIARWMTADYTACRGLLLSCLFNVRLRRLFAIACCREACTEHTNPVLVAALDTVERHADRKESHARVTAAFRDVSALAGAGYQRENTFARTVEYATATSDHAHSFTRTALRSAEAVQTRGGDHREMLRRQARILVSFAFRTYPAEWRTSNTHGLAAAIYNNKTYGDAPVLADALQDAGCDDAALLADLRDPTFPLHRGNALLDFLRTT